MDPDPDILFKNLNAEENNGLNPAEAAACRYVVNLNCIAIVNLAPFSARCL